MKNKLISVAVVLLLVLATTLIVNVVEGGTVAASELTVGEAVSTITSNGEAVIEVEPDVAYITVGVIAENEELEKAQNEASKNMSSVMVELKKLGVDDTDIKTLNFNISPKYDWTKGGKGIIVGYIVNNMIKVTIHDLNNVGKVIDGVSLNGANSISNLQFSLKDESKIYEKALELAVKDAKGKAEAMGRGVGKINLKPLSIVETSRGRSTVITRETKDMVNGIQEVTPINVGEIQVRASVTAEFSF